MKRCPVCNSKNMHLKENYSLDVKPKGYKSITVDNLTSFVCNDCGESFFNTKSKHLFYSKIAEGKALQDSVKYKTNEFITVKRVSTMLRTTRQRVHQMLDEGKLPYVFVDDEKIIVYDQDIIDKLKDSVANTHKRVKR
jgi:YgiT-type zinc finger domain-containing protein